MGKSSQQSSSQTTVTPSAQETEYNKILLDNLKAQNPQLLATQGAGLDLSKALLTGGALPGAYSNLYSGISPDAIGAEAAKLTRQLNPQWQAAGLFDSEVAGRETARSIANDLLFPAEQFNLGQKLNLLNLGLGGQAQVQQPISAFSGQLGANLQGLRSTSQTGNTTNRYGFFTSPFTTGLVGGLGTGFGTGFGSVFGNSLFAPTKTTCWVASEIFGGWFEEGTIFSRIYVLHVAPKWFMNLYTKYGKQFARFIKNKSILKAILRPIFENFAKEGKKYARTKLS